MRRVTLEELLMDSVCRKHLPKAGIDHSIRVAEIAFDMAVEHGVDTDLATKAGLLHDIGHGNFFNELGDWDYEAYSRGDIHPVKGAERAHELLVLKGEDMERAREVMEAILYHSGSTSIRPDGRKRTMLQAIIAAADDRDEQPDGRHHVRQIDWGQALERIRALDRRVEGHVDDEAGAVVIDDAGLVARVNGAEVVWIGGKRYVAQG
jgi:uncharacterized protein